MDWNLVFSQYRLHYLVGMPQDAWALVIFLIMAFITGWAGLFKGLRKEATYVTLQYIYISRSIIALYVMIVLRYIYQIWYCIEVVD